MNINKKHIGATLALLIFLLFITLLPYYTKSLLFLVTGPVLLGVVWAGSYVDRGYKVGVIPVLAFAVSSIWLYISLVVSWGSILCVLWAVLVSLLFYKNCSDFTKGGEGPKSEPDQVWWAMLPFEDKAKAKDRPVLITEDNGGRWVRVRKITSQKPNSNFADQYTQLPTQTWSKSGKQSWLKTGGTPFRIRRDALRRRAGKIVR